MMKTSQMLSSNCSRCEAGEICFASILTGPQMDKLMSARTMMQFHRNQIIFSAETKPLGVYCLRKGPVKLTVQGTQTGIQQILYVAKKGEMLGVDDVISGSMYHCTAQALEDVEVCLIEKETFLDLLSENKELAHRLLVRAAQSVKNRDSSICRLSRYNVRERTAQTLVSLMDEHGMKMDQGVKLKLQLTRREIAQMSGTVPESVVRILSDFKKDGLIQIHKREITILDQQGLMKVYDPTWVAQAAS